MSIIDFKMRNKQRSGGHEALDRRFDIDRN